MPQNRLQVDRSVATQLLDLYFEVSCYPIELHEGSRVISPSKPNARYRSFCRRLHGLGCQAMCETDHQHRARDADVEASSICYAGLHLYTLPITVSGEAVASLVGGQVRLDDSEQILLSDQRRQRLYEELKFATDQKLELEGLYFQIPSLDQTVDELPFLDYLRAVQTQFYELLSLELKWRQAQQLLDASRVQIAHEFQIRLQALMARSYNLSNKAQRVGLPIGAQIAEDAREVLNEVKRLNVLVQNLKTGLGDYIWRLVPIRPLVSQSVDLYSSEATAKDLRFILDVDDVAVRLSETHILHALNNLIHNAVKYSYRGSSFNMREIKITGSATKAYYELAIENYGIGVLPDELDAIFKEGYRGRLTRDESRVGAGLGLAISKKIIEAHDGSIAVSSQPTGNAYLTRFTVRLPLTNE